ncbi:hypothetical protein BC938DRAFT_476522 [Jimgerdemannia flammicorona]|uniref:Uncharacterized protein n=1 Tax=Jimgerdemannia flammicorona TaxID=994334 RepID=A0A433R0N0_9FUNG|nr:hypothetical protein BC938DRAFT_476522 [Jimgerdemannia flammicorona]
MHLLPECLDGLQYAVFCLLLIARFMNNAFWRSTDNTTLKKFLDFRLSAGNLEVEETEHNRYELHQKILH